MHRSAHHRLGNPRQESARARSQGVAAQQGKRDQGWDTSTHLGVHKWRQLTARFASVRLILQGTAGLIQAWIGGRLRHPFTKSERSCSPAHS